MSQFTKLPLALFTLLAGCGAPLCAQDDKALRVWPDKTPDEPAGISKRKAETATGGDGVIRIRYVDKPELVRFPAPAAKATGACMIICPGGGYNILAWNLEGTEIAAWLNSIGVEAIVLKYRVPRRDGKKPHPLPLQDLQRSIRIVRSRAAEWKIDPKRVGIMGFSAGGHLSVMASSYFNESSYKPIDAIDKLDARPSFVALIYPAYLGNAKKDPGKLDSLVKVSQKTPPTFIAITHDDGDRALFAALYYAELRRNRVAAELHIYSNPDFSPDFVARSRKWGCGKECGAIRPQACFLHVEDRLVSTDAVHSVAYGPQ